MKHYKQQTPKDYTKPVEMTKKQLNQWIKWAEDEVKEYTRFIQKLTKELNTR